MLPIFAAAQAPPTTPPLSAPDTAWMMVSTALVLLMVPAVALFYGGLVRAKSALNTMMMCLAAFGVVGVTWALVGYSLAFAPGSALIGGLDHLALRGVGLDPQPGTAIPALLFMAYQASFAVVTAVLIAGAVVERMRFAPYLAFVALWTAAVYAPIAHWVWGGGWLAGMGVLDFAGGTVVHVNAGVAALVAAFVVGGRKDYGRQAMLPHNVPFVLLGSALLYFGWFGFNAGSALAANGSAVTAFANTMLAPMSCVLVWMGLDALRSGKPTAVGAATGIVIGLVAITPAAGFVGPAGALLVGALAAPPSYYAIVWRARTRVDDSLDVFAGHGVGGIVGALLTGVLADPMWGTGRGLVHGNAAQVGLQALGVAAALVYSGAATWALLRLVGLVARLEATPRAQGVGMDVTQHGEEAYGSGEGAVLLTSDRAGDALGAPTLDAVRA